MREILFRGKRIDNGEWVDGFLLKECNYATCSWNLAIEYKTDRFGKFAYDVAEIDTKTICQFTGLTDKNGKKIFEGDILKFSDCGIYPVWWDADFFTFGSCWFSDFDPLYKYDKQKIEVIGNIHDNPELLEVTDNA